MYLLLEEYYLYQNISSFHYYIQDLYYLIPFVKNLYSGTNNTFLGANTSSSLTNLSSSTAIGYNAQVTTSNQIVIGTSAESTYIPGKLLVNNINIIDSLPISLFAKGSTLSNIVTSFSLANFDSLKNVNVLVLPQGVFTVRFSISMTCLAVNENGTLEYGLSYDTTSMTLSKNRQIISTRYENDPTISNLKVIDSSLPYIFHEYTDICTLCQLIYYQKTFFNC